MPPLKAKGEFNIYIQLWGQSCANAAGTNLWHTALVPWGAAGPRDLPHAGALMVLPQKQLLQLLNLLCGRERGKRGKGEWGEPRDAGWPHLDGSREWTKPTAEQQHQIQLAAPTCPWKKEVRGGLSLLGISSLSQCFSKRMNAQIVHHWLCCTFPFSPLTSLDSYLINKH